MKFSYNIIQSYFDKKLPPAKKVAGLITEKAFEVESVKRVGQDWALEIKILPDRFSDCSGHIGIAREIAAILGIKLNKKANTEIVAYQTKDKKNNLKQKSEKTGDYINIKIKDNQACPFYVSKILKGVKIGPSPKWLDSRLKTCGLQSINNIVDAANYVMLETGQPLHCFDLDKLKNSIIVRWANEGEEIETLDNQKFVLDKDVLLIADEEKPLAIAGIKGGVLPAIDKKTKNIAIESAFFNPVLIRETSKKLGISTDACLRFSKGINQLFTEFSANRLASLIKQLAGGEILNSPIFAGTKPASARKILSFDLKRFERFAGFSVPAIKIKLIFKNLGFKIFSSDKNKIELEVPVWRSDIEIFENLAEEVLRFSGYNKIEEKNPLGILIPPKKNEENFWQYKIKENMASFGYSEIYSYSFVSENDLKNFSINPKNTLELENPISSEFAYLRPTQIINLLKISGDNLRYRDRVKLFELGKCFQKSPISPYEELRLAILISGKDKKEPLFLEIKGVVERIINNFGVWDLEFSGPKNNAGWLALDRAAEIKSGKETIGFLGQIAPSILKKYNNDFPAVACELDFKQIIKLANEEKEFTPLPKYPAVIRDISLILESQIKIADVLNIIYSAGSGILKDVDLFDIYEDENSQNNLKSLAFHLIFQSDEKTLTSKEVDELVLNITQILKEKLEAEIK